MARSTDDRSALLLARLEQELPRAVELRRRLHAAPELAHEEQQTSATIAAELRSTATVTTAAVTGLLARVGADIGAPVAVRAELDGLPIEEQTDSPFSAAGGAMHACGHDVHMAALVALARAAAALGEDLPAPLLAIFQPSEEAYPSGARQLADAELAAAQPRAVVAAHIHPELAWGTVALNPGAVNAASDSVEITVDGAPSHGAYPHLGHDPILAIAQIVVALHAEAGRRTNPLGAAVVNVGVLEGGGAENVIPPRARARASLRAHRAEDRAALREMVQDVVRGVAAAHGCRGVAELIAGEPALENDAQIVARARAARGGGPRGGGGVALVWVRRLCLLRRARADRDGLRRSRGRAGLRGASAASPAAAATGRGRRSSRARAGNSLPGGRLRLSVGSTSAQTPRAASQSSPRLRSRPSRRRGRRVLWMSA